MEQKEIIEGNKLIAEFMGETGLTKVKHLGYKIPVGRGKKSTVEATKLVPYVKSYSTLWENLMPVWIKFKSLQFTNVTARHYHKQICTSFGNGILSGDIKNAWADAVMAIKWHNQQTNQTLK